MDEQPRLIDLVPRRLSVMGLLLMAGLGMAAALLALHAWMFERAAVIGRYAALDLGGERSLGTWFCWLLLLAASLAAVLVYTVRRYRADDYQGHYRIWLWGAMCWFLLSTDKAASLHEGLQQMMVQLTGTRLFGDGAVWWMIPYFFLLAAIGSRLLLDMRHCWLSSTALLAAAACGGLAMATRMGWVLPEADPRTVMLKAGAEMGGGVFLLLAMGLHARYVIFDAEGLLPPRRAKRNRSSSAPRETGDQEQAAADGERTDIHSPAAAAQPAWRPSTSAAPAAAAANLRPAASGAVAQGVGSSVDRKLTKGERKALRQRLEQQRLNRQQQQRSGWGS